MRVTSFDAEDQDLQYRIDIFMANSKIGTLLNRSGMVLTVGVTPNEFVEEMNNRVTAAVLSKSGHLSDCVFQRAIPKTKRLNHINSPILERGIDQIRRIRNNNRINLISQCFKPKPSPPIPSIFNKCCRDIPKHLGYLGIIEFCDLTNQQSGPKNLEQPGR